VDAGVLLDARIAVFGPVALKRHRVIAPDLNYAVRLIGQADGQCVAYIKDDQGGNRDQRDPHPEQKITRARAVPSLGCPEPGQT